MATVPTEVSELNFAGSGAAVAYPITFPILRTSDLVVDLLLDGETVPTVQVEGVDYTVSAAPSAGPTLTMAVAPPLNSNLRVRRTVRITQEVNLQTQGPFSPATLTQMADKGVMIDQQLDRRLRALESAGAVGSVVAGDGLEFDGAVLHVRAGDGILVGADEVAVDFSSDAADLSDVSKSAANAGVLTSVARADHKHDVSTAAAVELTDAANAEGDATSLARSNHTHAHGNRGGGALHAVATNVDAGFMSAADKAAFDLLTGNRSHVRAYRAAVQTIPLGVDTTIVFNTEDWDVRGEYDTATGIFTAQQTGYYLITCNVKFDVATVVPDDSAQIYVQKNGAGIYAITGDQAEAATANRNFYCTLSTTIRLTAGDTVRIKAIGTVDLDVVDILASHSWNSLTIDRLL